MPAIQDVRDSQGNSPSFVVPSLLLLQNVLVHRSAKQFDGGGGVCRLKHGSSSNNHIGTCTHIPTQSSRAPTVADAV